MKFEVVINYKRLIGDCGTPQKVAEQLGCHYTTVYRWLRGHPPNVDVLSKIITKFNLNLTDYINDGDYINDATQKGTQRKTI